MKVEIPMYHDVWMDNALLNFCRLASDTYIDTTDEITINPSNVSLDIPDIEQFTEELSKEIINKKNPAVVIKERNKKTLEEKEIKKDFILIQEKTKVGGIVALKENVYDPNRSKYLLKDVFEKLDGSGKRCVMCSREFKDSIKNLQQASYPFVTKIKSLSGVRGFDEYYKDYCPICYLIGVLEWMDNAMIYRTFPADRAYLLLPISDNLISLKNFRESYSYGGILNNAGRYSNIRNPPPNEGIENTPGKYSTLLSFYEKFFEKTDYSKDIGKKWGVIEIPLSGSVKNPKLHEIEISKNILNVIRYMVKNDDPVYSEFVRRTTFFELKNNGIAPNFDLTAKFREGISQALINDDFRSFSRFFLPRRGGHVGFGRDAYEILEELVWKWRFEKMGISKEEIGAIRSVGNIVAEVARKNVSSLYNLDKARTIGEFWTVLRGIARKMISLEDDVKVKIKPMSLDALIELTKNNEEEWKEIRDLLVIYSSIYYSIKSKPKRGE